MIAGVDFDGAGSDWAGDLDCSYCEWFDCGCACRTVYEAESAAYVWMIG